MHRRSAALAIVITLGIAIILRLWGAKWGLPADLHYYSYHPDENMVLGAATRVDLLNGRFDPGFYNYGSLYIYLAHLAIVVATMCGWVNLSASDLSANIGQVANLYLTGRIVAILMGIATIYFTYLLGKKAYGRGPGILAALFMALIPIHVMHSRFMAVDVPSTLFVVLTLVFAMRLMDGCRLRDYILAGLFAGLAAGTKYNAGIALIAPVVMHFFASKSKPVFRVVDPRMLGMVACAVIGFTIGTPGIFINQPQFIHDFLYEVNHARSGHGLVFVQTGSGYLFHLMHSLLPGMGLPLLILAIAGFIYAIGYAMGRPRELHVLYRAYIRVGIGSSLIAINHILILYDITYFKWPLLIAAAIVGIWGIVIRIRGTIFRHASTDIALLAFVVVYYAIIGAAQVRFARYTIPMLPVLALLAARVTVDLYRRLSTGTGASGIARKAFIAAIVVAVGYTALYSISIDNMMAGPDTRDRSIAWIRENIAQGTSIGLPTIPWFYTPPFYPEIGLAVTSEERLKDAQDFTDYLLDVNGDREWDADYLKGESPDYVVVSEFEAIDRLRIGDASATQYFEVLSDAYDVKRRFTSAPNILGIRMPLPVGLPHDMSYADPAITIYGRKGAE